MGVQQITRLPENVSHCLVIPAHPRRCGEVGTPSFTAAAMRLSVSAPADRAERTAQRHADRVSVTELHTFTGFQRQQQQQWIN